MEFNARISRAETDTQNPDDAILSLQKMLRSSKFSGYKDKIYYTLGNIYQKQNKNDKNRVKVMKTASDLS